MDVSETPARPSSSTASPANPDKGSTASAAWAGDFSEVERLLKVLQHPYDEPALPSDAGFPPDWA